MAKVCEICVLPESSVIHLNTDGICNVCNSDSLNKFILGKPDNTKLLGMIAQIKERGKLSDYDCIVGWSGGRDSTCLLYELVNIHQLRCIAIFGRTPFTPIEIVNNVHAIAEKLGVKLIEFKTPDNHLDVARYCLKTFVKTKASILINLACASCKDVNRVMFKQAKQLGINAIIYGAHRYEYIPLSPAAIDIDTSKRFSFSTMLKDNVIRIIKGIVILVSYPRLLKYFFTFFKGSILYVNPYTVYLRLRYPKIERFDYYFYADWEESRVFEILEKLDWKLPAGCNSTWRADCTFEAVKNTAFEQRLGFTYAHALYSNLIRGQKISRSEALKRLKKEAVSEQRLSEVLKICNLPEDFLL
jgi:hypothetical protein